MSYIIALVKLFSIFITNDQEKSIDLICLVGKTKIKLIEFRSYTTKKKYKY